MRALDVALADKGMSRAAAEAQAGLAPGTLGLWMRGQRMPSALRLGLVAVKLDIDPGALMDDGMRRAVGAGLLADVEVAPREK